MSNSLCSAQMFDQKLKSLKTKKYQSVIFRLPFSLPSLVRRVPSVLAQAPNPTVHLLQVAGKIRSPCERSILMCFFTFTKYVCIHCKKYYYLIVFFQTYTGEINNSVNTANKFPIHGSEGVSSILIFGSSSWILHYEDENKKSKTFTLKPGYYDDVREIPNCPIIDDQIFAVERAN